MAVRVANMHIASVLVCRSLPECLTTPCRRLDRHSILGQGSPGSYGVAARIVGHASMQTMQLYNKLPEEISLDDIKCIYI